MAHAIGRVAIVGLGLIGSSVARAIKAKLPDVAVTGHDADPDVRAEAQALGFCDAVSDDAAEAVEGADLVILAVPVGRMADAAAAVAPGLSAHAIISDVGSSKAGVGAAHAVAAVTGLWQALGAKVETMDAAHHDMVLAVTSHLPHLIAYTIVGTASELEEVTESEVIKYSAGGFRDFTRIAASDPVMWRDVFLANRDAVLATLQRFNEDLTALQQAIRRGDGDRLEDWFTRTRAIRRSIIEQGQDDAAPDFGRKH